MLSARPHHDGSALYVSAEGVGVGDTVLLRVRVPADFGVANAVHVRSTPNREPRFDAARVIADIDGVQWWQASVVLENPVLSYRFLLTFADGTLSWLNATGVHTIDTVDAADFRFTTFAPPPAWAASAVMYQVFPDRFARSREADDRPVPDWAIPAAWSEPVSRSRPETSLQFYGGDLAGIEERLDHLTRLGISVLYLTPFFAARSNHRYDSISFDKVDPLLGGDAALISLVAAAHARGIRVIGDLTTNHTGDGHEWFTAAISDQDAVEGGFYYWLDDDATRYASWLGVPSLPKLNWSSQELRDRLIEGPNSVVARWLSEPFNLDGWRIDVGNMTGRYGHDDFSSEVRRIIRRTMADARPDALLIGESTSDASPDMLGDGWHGAMSYAPFTRPIWNWLSTLGAPAGGSIGSAQATFPAYSGEDVHATNVEFLAGYPWAMRCTSLNALDTHDLPRFLTNARSGTFEVALGLSMTMPGIPLVWAGDEFGLTAIDGEDSRTPLQWDSIDDAADTVALYSRLTQLRREHEVLANGSIRWLHASTDAIAFARESASETVVVVATRAENTFTLSASSLSGIPRYLCGTATLTFENEWRADARGPSFSVWALPGVELPQT